MRLPSIIKQRLQENINVDHIDANIDHLEKLQNNLTAEVLSKFAASQPYGINSDEYKAIKQLKDTDPSNYKLQLNCRLADYPAYFEETIPKYNANVVKGYIVCEGPDPDQEDSITRFLDNVCWNKRHAAVDTIIISGMPDDHFSKPYEQMLNYANYVPVEPGNIIEVSGNYTVSRKQPSNNRSTPGIEHICLEITQCRLGITAKKQLEVFRFIKNPDLQRAQITENDMPLLSEIALREPGRVVFHCGAGLSRSISKLLMFVIFNKILNQMSHFVKNEKINTESFLNNVADEFRRIRICRPGAIGNNDLLIEAILLAIQLRKEMLISQRQRLTLISTSAEQRILSGEKHQRHRISVP